ncbi:DUF4132 domain-containing protein [Streptomyces sp. NPDC049040]|uniref:DUF4132 domain-containing protein n=1 Tax=Streptomyces sp. NPDC049040 TaxID=3365593 RepID=UPI0037105A78
MGRRGLVAAEAAERGDIAVAQARGVELPDEETFEMPAAWRRLVYPRRGGIRVSVAAPHPEGEELLARRFTEESALIGEMLASPDSDPELAGALRAHIDGAHSPLGAAVLAHLTRHYQMAAGVFVDEWVRTHGLVFAARAVVEYFDTAADYRQSGSRRSDARLVRHPAGRDITDLHGQQCAERLRVLLSVAEEDAYREVVAALESCRFDARRRVVVSFLVPGETEWVAECCADPTPDDRLLRMMLLASLGSSEQLARFVAGAGRLWNTLTMPLIATLAESTGTSFTPLLEEALETAYGADRSKMLAGVLLEIPTDDAFRLLLARVDDKHVRPQLLSAMRRHPVRALRLLGAAAQGGGKDAATARLLLTSHVRSFAETATAVLPDLAPDVAALVEQLLDRGDLLPEAPVEALPALLVDPPWAGKRTVRKPRVAAEVPAAPGPRVVWKAGEQEAWAGTDSWYAEWRRTYDWSREIKTLQAGGALKDVREARLFVVCDEDVVRPLLATWTPEDFWDGEASLKPVAARFGVDALPLLLQASARQPATLNVLLLPYLSAEAARQVCDWLARLKSADATARAWLTRHGLATVPYLAPFAVGPAGVARRGAERALRLLAAAHGAEAVGQAAAEAGSETAAIIREVLAADPLESALPARMPAIGVWADPGLLPQLVLVEGGALPHSAVDHAITLLLLSKPGEVYPGLDVLTSACTADSLSAFAWALFEQWRLAGMPPKDSWALHALGWLGDDETVRRLTPVLRAWPGEGAHHRAVEGLEVLAAIGSDVALMHLHGIAQRVPFKALKVRAQQKIAEVAESLGLTADQLGDRLVPDFGLEADGSTVIDYGPRRFTVGFDEQLRPYVLDADGKRRKALPAPGAKDDAELAPAERKRFAALKKDVRTVAADQVRRLEAAMVAGRTWPAGEFRELFVAHPLLWHLVRRLVWLAEAADPVVVTAFRVAEDRTFADVEDDAFMLPDDATVTLAHPLHLGADVAAWSELFADYEILQPFPQLGRPLHAFTDEEAAGHRLARFEGETVPVGRLLGLTSRGWQRGVPQDAGVERWFHRQVGDNRHVVIALDQGIAVGMVDTMGDQTFETVWLDARPGDYFPSRRHSLRFGDLDPVIASEVLADLTEVTAK